MKTRILPVLLSLLASVAVASAENRPADWSKPVASRSLHNLYQVTPELYRSAQPNVSSMRELKALGIRSIISLRSYHSDAPVFKHDGLVLVRCPMHAGSLTRVDLIKALQAITDAPKPVLLHCWHGSDRTGTVIAAYRMVWQNWPAAKAIAELRNGGYGFHEVYFNHIKELLEGLDPAAIRKELEQRESPKRK